MSQLFRTKSIDALIAAAEEPQKRLRKTLGPWSLTAFGIGAVIGCGIFILTGTAAAGETDPNQIDTEGPVWTCCCTGRMRFPNRAAGRRTGASRYRSC